MRPPREHRAALKRKKYLKGKNWRSRRLQSGQWAIEIRIKGKTKDYKKLPISIQDDGDVEREAHRMLTALDNPTASPFTKELLEETTFNDLTNAYMKYVTGKIHNRTIKNILSFQRNNKQIHSLTLNQHRLIVKRLQDYVNDRCKEDILPGTVIKPIKWIRAMYNIAGKKRLFGLAEDSLTLDNPFTELDLPEDTTPHRTQYLKQFHEHKIFKAIHEYCKGSQQRLKWNTLVSMALITCLRRGVLLHLKWGDVNWNEMTIKIDKSYWGRGKRAPEKTPMTRKLYDILRIYQRNLQDVDRGRDVPIFESMAHRRYRLETGKQKPYSERWADKQWGEIIRHTNLYEERIGKSGKIERDWFHFHDLRATAETWYAREPYSLWPEQYGFLMGHLGRKKRIQDTYDRGIDEICNEIRDKIERGDAELVKQLQTLDGDIPMPHEIAHRYYVLKGAHEKFREHRDSIKQSQGLERTQQLESALKNSQYPDIEELLEAKAKADEFNQHRKEYKRKYEIYPESDIWMHSWFDSDSPMTVDKDRARLYLFCRLNSSAYKDYKELKQRFQSSITTGDK